MFRTRSSLLDVCHYCYGIGLCHPQHAGGHVEIAFGNIAVYALHWLPWEVEAALNDGVNAVLLDAPPHACLLIGWLRNDEIVMLTMENCVEVLAISVL